MTCIVGIEQEGVVYLGADSAAGGNGTVEVRRDRKVFRKRTDHEEFIMGFTSSWRMGHLLQWALKPPEWNPASGENLHEYMCTSFADTLRKTFSDGGYSWKKDEHEMGGSFLVGYWGRLFEVDTEYGVGEFEKGYTAIGSGHQYALGSLHTTERISTMEPGRRIGDALLAASEFSEVVRPPFHVEALRERR
jgi:ATP-dependent protease HslVU (ClpYQ) peptidase subunit